MAVNTLNELITLLNAADTDASALAAITNDSATSTDSSTTPGYVDTRLNDDPVKNVRKVIADIENGITTNVRPAVHEEGVEVLNNPAIINFVGDNITVTDGGSNTALITVSSVGAVGTPVDNQVGVWTGDDTLEGTSELTFNGSTLTITNDSGPALSIVDSNDSVTFLQQIVNPGTPAVQIGTTTAHNLEFRVDGSTHMTLDTSGDLNVTGNITVGGTVEGVDIANAVTKVATPADNQIGVWTGDGTLEGDANLTWDGTALDITGDITVSGTVDGVDIANAVTKVGTPADNQIGVWTGDGTIEGDANLTWDGALLVIGGTDALQVPDGTTAERPGSPAAGMIRYNTDNGNFEGYSTTWEPLVSPTQAVNTQAGASYSPTLDDNGALIVMTSASANDVFIGRSTVISDTITGITNAASAVVTTTGDNSVEVDVGDEVTITNVVGMTELNGNTYEITAISGNDVTINVDSSGFGTYSSGGDADFLPEIAYPIGYKIDIIQASIGTTSIQMDPGVGLRGMASTPSGTSRDVGAIGEVVTIIQYDEDSWGVQGDTV